MKKLSLFFFSLLFLYAPVSIAAPCNYYWNSTIPVPAGFGAAFDVFNPSVLLLTANCSTPPNVTVTIGEGSPTQAIYKTAYLSKDAVSWVPVSLSSGTAVVPQDYFSGSASATLNLSSGDLDNWNYVAFLVAYNRNGTWVYGCRDRICAENDRGWNLQSITTASFSPQITAIVLSSTMFATPATTGTTIATLSDTRSDAGSGSPVFSFGASIPFCNGRDNGKFSISGTSLKIGGSTVPTESYLVCLTDTDAGASNSPFSQGFVLIGGAPPVPTAVSVSPMSVTITDATPVGTIIATATVTMSDASMFTGTLSVTGTTFLTGSGSTRIVTSRPLTSDDDGGFVATISPQ